MNATAPSVLFLLVGHCGPDASMLRSAIRRAVPAATFAEANDDAALGRHRDDGSIWLVNRALDGEFSVADGVALILRERGRVPIALISNFPDSQAAAVAAGAMPGFGKSSLNSDSTARVIAAMVKG